MRIKIFIVTWNDANALNSNLHTLFEGYKFLQSGLDITVHIINNHTNFSVDPRFVEHVHVIHNRATPDFATAMLGRMWNTALIHGFKDLNNPDADIVVTAQDDTVWNIDWIPKLLEIHKKYNFYADDAGDMVCSYTADAVKTIGLWDERFHYGFGEADYYLRAIRWNKDKSSINDFAHGRTWNTSTHLAKRPEPNIGRYEEQNRSHQFRGLSWQTFMYKWRYQSLEGNWSNNIEKEVFETPMVPHHILYPYFEKNVVDLHQKGYITG